MSAKGYLQGVKVCYTKIKCKQEELEVLNSLATKMTSSLSGDPVSGTKNNDKMCDSVAKMETIQEEIRQEIESLKETRNAVILLMENIKDANQYHVLYERYILFKTWEQIACDMDYSYYGVCKLHGRALQNVEKLLNCERVDRS